MAFFDLSLNELKIYLPDREEPADFDSFWKSTVDEARAFPLNATFEKVDNGLVAQDTFDATLALTYEVTRDFSLNASYNFTIVNSNVGTMDYYRNRITFGGEYSF